MRTDTRIVAAAAALTLVAGAGLAQTTHHVPGTYPTILDGLAVAAPGDTVLVAPGTYHEHDLSFGGKDIALVSEAGPELTTIDAQSLGRVFLFTAGETQAALLEGFTLQRGQAPSGASGGPQQIGWPGEHGGGIQILGASPTIRDCVVRWNVAGEGGQGGAGQDGDDGIAGHLDGYDGENGYAGGPGGDGGGIYIQGGAPTIEGCTFLANAGGTGGQGGPGGDGGDGEEIWPFSGDGGDGGQGGWGARGGQGGAIAAYSSSALVRSCILLENDAGSPGQGGPGGAAGYGDSWGNPGPDGFSDVSGKGGAIYLFASSDEINGCTILDGSALAGGGVYALGGGTIYNSILRGNTPDQILGVSLVAHSNVEGGFPGTGNQSGAPMFREPLQGDYRLTAGSPCIDAGDQALGSPWIFDVDGIPRVVASDTDMGAHEYDVPYLGTLEDLVLATQVNGLGFPTDWAKTAVAGDLVTLNLDSPGMTFLWAKPLFVFQGYTTGGTLPGSPGLPGIWVNGGFPNLTFLDLAGGPLGPILLPPGGMTLGFVVPPGLVGTTVRMQGIVLSPLATNGIYAATEAHELMLL